MKMIEVVSSHAQQIVRQFFFAKFLYIPLYLLHKNMKKVLVGKLKNLQKGSLRFFTWTQNFARYNQKNIYSANSMWRNIFWDFCNNVCGIRTSFDHE